MKILFLFTLVVLAGAFSVNDVFAQTPNPDGVLKNEETCTNLVGGTWGSSTNTCTILHQVKINSEQVLFIDPEITLKISQTAGCGIVQGTIYNNGILTLTHDVCYGIISTTIYNKANGIINVANTGESLGIEHQGILHVVIHNEGTINVSNSGRTGIEKSTIYNNATGIINVNNTGASIGIYRSIIFNEGTLNVFNSGLINSQSNIGIEGGEILNLGIISVSNKINENSRGISITTVIFNKDGGIIYDEVRDKEMKLLAEKQLEDKRKLNDAKKKTIDDANTVTEKLAKYEKEFEDPLNTEPYTVLESDSIKNLTTICGEGTILKDGQCIADATKTVTESKSISKGGCLIATATYGSELAPQVQQLRELRDNSLLQTASGTSFMVGFNQFYYLFSPTMADWERENPVFKEAVKITLTPMISSLSILNYVDMDSEVNILGYGISLILLNVGMYFVAPAIVIHTIRKKF